MAKHPRISHRPEPAEGVAGDDLEKLSPGLFDEVSSAAGIIESILPPENNLINSEISPGQNEADDIRKAERDAYLSLGPAVVAVEGVASPGIVDQLMRAKQRRADAQNLLDLAFPRGSNRITNDLAFRQLMVLLIENL